MIEWESSRSILFLSTMLFNKLITNNSPPSFKKIILILKNPKEVLSNFFKWKFLFNSSIFHFFGSIRIFQFVFIILLLSQQSCKKENLTNSNLFENKPTFMSSTPTGEEILNQIKWISRGVAFLAENSSFKIGVENELMLSPIFEASNANVNSGCITHQNYYYSDSLNSILDFRYPSNDYDPLYFGGFASGNTYDNYFVIRSPELDLADTSLQHLIIPENILIDTNQYLAYFMNGNNLDSMVIEEDDFDEYYIWIVGLDQVSKFYKTNDFCNNDGDCQPWLGETLANCEDCQEENVVTDKMGKLFLESIKSKKDTKNLGSDSMFDDYEENFIKFKLAFHYVTVSDNTRQGATITSSEPGVNSASVPIVEKFSANGNNCDVKRRKSDGGGGFVSNRGIENKVKNIHVLLDEDFNLDQDSMHFVFFELDPTFGNYNYFRIPWLNVDLTYRSFRNTISKYSTISSPFMQTANLSDYIVTMRPPQASSPFLSGWSVVGQSGGRDILECTLETTEYALTFRIEPSR